MQKPNQDNENHYSHITQIQIQENKRNQALKYSYETLNNLLSTAENFAGLPNEKYKEYNITTSYDYENLKSEFVWELHCFQLAIKQFEKKFKCSYEFPNNFPKEKIKADIKTYKERISNKKDKCLYEEMLKLINGESTKIDFEKLFGELDENANSKINPNYLKNMIGPIINILDKNLEDANKGNMDLELSDKSHKNDREKLKNLNSKDIIKVKIGKEGKLIKGNNSHFMFYSKNNNDNLELTIDEKKYKLNNKIPDLYPINKGKDELLILNNNGNSYDCVIFDKNFHEVNKNCFRDTFILDNEYFIGYINLANVTYYALAKDFK